MIQTYEIHMRFILAKELMVTKLNLEWKTYKQGFYSSERIDGNET